VEDVVFLGARAIEVMVVAEVVALGIEKINGMRSTERNNIQLIMSGRWGYREIPWSKFLLKTNLIQGTRSNLQTIP
jgi:hypothetical protein